MQAKKIKHKFKKIFCSRKLMDKWEVLQWKREFLEVKLVLP